MDADTGTDKLIRGASGAGSAMRELTTSTPGQLLQSQCEQSSILNPVRIAYQYSDSELGSPLDRMYSLLHLGTGSGSFPSASAYLALLGEAPDMPPPVLWEEKPFPFPAVSIVERPVFGSGSCSNRKRLDPAEQEEVDRMNATSGAALTSYPDLPSPLPVTTSGATSGGTSGGLSGIPDQLYQLILGLCQGTRGVATVPAGTASSSVPASSFDTGHSQA